MQQDMSTRGMQFAVLVRQMRNAQKKYFSSQNSINLGRVKELERKVDDVLRSLNLPPDADPQAKMFN